MLFERNLKGDTPLSICTLLKLNSHFELLEKLQVVYDHTKGKTADFLNDLEAEEAKLEREKLRKKEKKYRSKLARIAEKDNCSVDEVAEKLKSQKDQEEQANKLQQELVLKNEAQEMLKRQ